MTTFEYMDALAARRDSLPSEVARWLRVMEKRVETASKSELFVWQTVAIEPDLISGL